MIKEIVDLNDAYENPVIIVKSQITHITPLDQKHSRIHFSGGQIQVVVGTVHELVSKIWPPNP